MNENEVVIYAEKGMYKRKSLPGISGRLLCNLLG
jgi:hypothetical protein